MKCETFLILYREAAESKDYDMYIAERGWQPWMDAYGENKIVDILSAIWEIAKAENKINKLRTISGLSYYAMSKKYYTPLKTIQNWGSNSPTASRQPPIDRILLLTYAVLSDMEII